MVLTRTSSSVLVTRSPLNTVSALVALSQGVDVIDTALIFLVDVDLKEKLKSLKWKYRNIYIFS